MVEEALAPPFASPPNKEDVEKTYYTSGLLSSMDQITRYLLAALMDSIVGVIPFFNLPFNESLGIVLLIAMIFSLIGSDLSLTLPVALVPFTYFSHSYALLLSSALASLISYYLKELSTSFLGFLGLSLLVLNVQAGLQVAAFSALIISLVYLKLDLRGGLITGLILIIVISLLNLKPGVSSSLVNPLSLTMFYSFLFSVLGIVVEDRKLPSRFPRTPTALLIYPLVTLILGSPESYYWWSSLSFYFNQSPLSLWVPFSYFPQLNQALGTWALSHLTSHFLGAFGINVYVASLTYVSGITSFLLFKKFNSRISTILALVYQLLSPFQDPYLLLGYAVLPFLAYLTTVKVRNPIKYSAIMLSSVIGSSFVLFPVSAIVTSVLTYKREAGWISLAILGANSFWIIPYLIFGGPVSPVISNYFFPLAFIIPAVMILAKWVEKTRVVIAVGSLVYLLSGLPWNEALYPVAILSLLLLLNEDVRKAITGITIFLLLLASVLQIANYHSIAVPSEIAKIDKQVENATLVSWNYSFPLLSSAPVNFSVLPSSLVQYFVNGNGNVTYNENYTGLIKLRSILPANLSVSYATWKPEIEGETILNSTHFSLNYSSNNISVSGSTFEALRGGQFIGWRVPNLTNFSISIVGDWVVSSYSEDFFLTYNLSNQSSYPINFNTLIIPFQSNSELVLFNGSSEFRSIGSGAPLPQRGPFNVTFSFIEAGNRTTLYSETVNGREFLEEVNTTLPDRDLAFGFLIPIHDELNLSLVEISYFFPIKVTESWVSWYSSVPVTVRLTSSVPLNGTLYYTSTPIKLEVNGSPITNGSTVQDLKEINFLTEGFVNITMLKSVDSKIVYVVGRPNVNTSYSFKVTPILNGERIVTESELPLNFSVYNMGYAVKVNGIFIKGYNGTLPPGKNVVELVYPSYSTMEYVGLGVSLLSFALAILQDYVRSGLLLLTTLTRSSRLKAKGGS
ncbi:MAG: hypothetical protein QXD10_07795 [Metallosphaera sp.]|uniref:hypothetical protein n=1 Tax=Metallosphaera sp. TaxID=2020860 RepID=UPI00316718E3